MELSKKDSFEMAVVNETDVPAIIQNQFLKMQDARSELDVARGKAESAQSSAYGSKDSKAGIFKNKQAIEALQDVAVELADAQLASTEAQVKAFEYQQTLAEITKYLFGLGVTNIAMNRCVVHELELRIDHASEEEIDEMTRNEITNVVKQLKAQEDVLIKQTELSKIVHDQEERIAEMKITSQRYYDKIDDLVDENHRLSRDIKELSNTIEKKNKTILYVTIASVGLGLVALLLAILAICS